MRPRYFTLQDDTLIHQVRFLSSGNNIVLSCNCRKTLNNTTYKYDPIGISEDLDQSRELYNNPANHWKLFTETDKAKW